MNEEKENVLEQGLMQVSESQLETVQRYGIQAPRTREEAELVRDMLEADALLESMELDSINSKNLLNIEIDVLDALFVGIPDKELPGGVKQCVRFLVVRKDTGETVTCLKSSNTFNDAYVNWFRQFRALGGKRESMEFFENQKFIRAGNAAICLRKFKPVEKAVGKR